MNTTFFTVSLTPLPKRSFFLEIIAGTAIWSVIIPLVIMHAWVWVYQEIYFSYHDIPKARLKDYVSFDRSQLAGLNLGKKLACAYCAYGNGVAAWVKAVINRTEAYSCAIKHKAPILGNEHQAGFLPYEEFVRS